MDSAKYQASRQALHKTARAAWRRAADELLIDAIFGAAPHVIRDVTPPPASLLRGPVVDSATLAQATR